MNDRSTIREQTPPRASRSVAPERPHRVIDVETEAGLARAFVVDAAGQSAGDSAGETGGESARVHGTLVFGHGAGKGTNTPDLHGLLALADEGWRVILVDQPWVLAGRRIATPAKTLDVGWRAVIARLRADGEIVGRFVQGGRSAGARVACRTAAEVGASAVIALAFPLMPPGKENEPAKWRTAEAQSVIDAGIALLVVQGERDTFGGPDAIAGALPGADLAIAAGAHGFSRAPHDVTGAVKGWLVARLLH